jgi:hypothetical protein
METAAARVVGLDMQARAEQEPLGKDTQETQGRIPANLMLQAVAAAQEDRAVIHRTIRREVQAVLAFPQISMVHLPVVQVAVAVALHTMVAVLEARQVVAGQTELTLRQV